MHYKLRPVPHRTISTRTHEGFNWQNVLHERYKSCTIQMGNTQRIYGEKHRCDTILYPVHKAGRLDCQGSLPYPVNGRLFGLARQRAQIHRVRCQWWVLACRNWRQARGQHDVHIAPWTIQGYENALSSKNAPKTFQSAMDITLSTVK